MPMAGSIVGRTLEFRCRACRPHFSFVDGKGILKLNGPIGRDGTSKAALHIAFELLRKVYRDKSFAARGHMEQKPLAKV